MDNTNLDDEQLQQIRAFGKVAEEATRNIASILQDMANRQERVEDDDEIQFIEQVQIPTTQRSQEINEVEVSSNRPVSQTQAETSNNAISQPQVERPNIAISQMTTYNTVTAQARPPYFLRNTQDECGRVPNTLSAPQNHEIFVPNTAASKPFINLHHNQFRYIQNAPVQSIAATAIYQQKRQLLCNRHVPIRNTQFASLSQLQNKFRYNQNFSVYQKNAATAPYRQQQLQQNIHSQNSPVQYSPATPLYQQQKHFEYNRLTTNNTNNLSFPCNYNQSVLVQNTPSTPLYRPQPNLLFNQNQNVLIPDTPSTSTLQHQYLHRPLFICHNQNIPVQQPPVISPYPSTSSSNSAGPSSNISSFITTTTTTSPFNATFLNPFPSNKVSKPQKIQKILNKKKPCNCNKSMCLKFYCACFANGEFCVDCNCKNCHNNLEHEAERSRAIKSSLEGNSAAFQPGVAAKLTGKTADTERLQSEQKVLLDPFI